MPFEEEVTPQFQDNLTRAKVHVGIRRLVSGSYSCRVLIFSEIASRLGWKPGDRLSIFLGSGADAGCIRLTRSPLGLAKIKAAREGKGPQDGSLVVMLGNFKGLPQKEFKPAPSHFEVIGNGSLDIDLPFAPEEKRLALAAPAPTTAVARVVSVPARSASVLLENRPTPPVNADNDPPLPRSIWRHPTDTPNVVDPEARKLRKEGVWNTVPKSEWSIFEKLAQNEGKLVSAERLWNCLYENEANGGPDPKIIDVFVCRLRKVCPFPIETVYGSGFILRGYAMIREDRKPPNVAAGVDKVQLMKGK